MAEHTPHPTEIAPGVHRLGDRTVNFYLVEHEEGLTLVDTGLPRHFDGLRAVLDRLDRTPEDIRAVLLTHAHPDHTGLAERLRRAGAEIWIQEKDAAALGDGPRGGMRHAKPERSLLPYLLRRPAALGAPLHLARGGAFTAPAVEKAHSFGAAGLPGTLPGGPQAVPVPGHTPGSTAYLFAERGLLFTGDALVTYDGLTGRTGPTLVARGFTHNSAAALASLELLSGPAGALVLPGHGEPFTEGPRAAVERARAAGRH
ncbi:MBL fold metallo-hydrolase [Streptomyces sp. SID1121]|uniref:MBL fold metallo-hydrolase n=1 Tax=Streptomyces sp. SID1121 TaxID=3425888 RepID=UPI0040576DC1